MNEFLLDDLYESCVNNLQNLWDHRYYLWRKNKKAECFEKDKEGIRWVTKEYEEFRLYGKLLNEEKLLLARQYQEKEDLLNSMIKSIIDFRTRYSDVDVTKEDVEKNFIKFHNQITLAFEPKRPTYE